MALAFDYANKELIQYKKSKSFLKFKGESIDGRAYLVANDVINFKINLIKKFWWRLGIYGIKQRIEIYKKIRRWKTGLIN